MFTEVNPQVYLTEECQGVYGPRCEWPTEGSPSVLSGKQRGVAVERLAGMRRIREAYQTATDTWIGAD